MTIKDITALLLPRQFRAYYGHQRSKKRSIPPSQGKKPEVSSCIPGHWGEGSSWVGCLGRVDILALISSYDPVPSPPSCKTPLCPAVAFAPHVTLRAVDGGGEGEGGGEVVTVIILYRQQPRRQPRRGRGPLLVGRRWTTQVFLLIRGALRPPARIFMYVQSTEYCQ